MRINHLIRIVPDKLSMPLQHLHSASNEMKHAFSTNLRDATSNRSAKLQLADHCPATNSWQVLAQRCAHESPYLGLSGPMTCAIAAPAQREQ